MLKATIASRGEPFEHTHDLDAKPLDREVTIALVEEVGRWAEGSIEG